MQHMIKILFGSFLLMPFSLIASEKGKEVESDSSFGQTTSRSSAVTVPLRGSSVSDVDEEQISRILEGSLSTIEIGGIRVPFTLTDDLRQALSDREMRRKFVSKFNQMQHGQISNQVESVEFYAVKGKIYTQIYGSELGL